MTCVVLLTRIGLANHGCFSPSKCFWGAFLQGRNVWKSRSFDGFRKEPLEIGSMYEPIYSYLVSIPGCGGNLCLEALGDLANEKSPACSFQIQLAQKLQSILIWLSLHVSLNTNLYVTLKGRNEVKDKACSDSTSGLR